METCPTRNRLNCGQTAWLVERFYGYLVPARVICEQGGQVALWLAGRMAFRASEDVHETRDAALAAAKERGMKLAGIWATGREGG